MLSNRPERYTTGRRAQAIIAAINTFGEKLFFCLLANQASWRARGNHNDTSRRICLVVCMFGFSIVSVDGAFANSTVAVNLRYAGNPGDDCVRCFDVTYGAGEVRPMLVFVHGGGWITGSHRRPGFRNLAQAYFARGFDVAVVGYRKLYLQNYHYPGPRLNNARQVQSLQEVAADVAAAVSNIKARFSPPRIILMGHSAGAHLAALVATSPGLLSNVGMSRDEISELILLDGHTYDLRVSLKERPGWLVSWHRHYNLFGSDFRNASPVFHSVRVPRELHPKVLIVSNGPTQPLDPDNIYRSYEQSLRYFRVLRRFGYDTRFQRYPGVRHGKMIAMAQTTGHPLFENIIEFLDAGTAEDQTGAD